ncbi:Uncharacterised protein [Vibrio cholerae]|uniref:Uncharacterized protein n=1 Tax=Vibrio cholerae TaxID=666 RepID=A0A655XAR6_VIBCL|nr:Uncharacterised protein [Vibrio cholerae]CSA45273.1 Uncharacterised protein [Vibrio cholerae]CSA98960.1 Uncharacterised protein [Vibrio cholerae]CSB31170.1 Uncharacterised protein [Vibrio cholerae]CSB33635.1 Uncharacterised protein [Vibrio cholerae]
MYPEAMLLINNDQGKMVKRHLLLKQSMGANHHFHFATGDACQLRFPRFAFELTREPADLNAHRL